MKVLVETNMLYETAIYSIAKKFLAFPSCIQRTCKTTLQRTEWEIKEKHNIEHKALNEIKKN